MWRPRPITFTFLTFLLMVTSLSVAAGTNSQSVEIEISESDAKDGLVVVGRWAPMLILLSIESGQFLLPGAYEGGNALAGGWVIDEPELMDSDQVLQIRIHHPDNPGHMQLISNEQTLKEGVAIRFPAGALRFSGDTSSPIAVSIHYESGVQADLVLSNTREINVDLDDEVEIAVQCGRNQPVIFKRTSEANWEPSRSRCSNIVDVPNGEDSTLNECSYSMEDSGQRPGAGRSIFVAACHSSGPHHHNQSVEQAEPATR